MAGLRYFKTEPYTGNGVKMEELQQDIVFYIRSYILQSQFIELILPSIDYHFGEAKKQDY